MRFLEIKDSLLHNGYSQLVGDDHPMPAFVKTLNNMDMWLIDTKPSQRIHFDFYNDVVCKVELPWLAEVSKEHTIRVLQKAEAASGALESAKKFKQDFLTNKG